MSRKEFIKINITESENFQVNELERFLREGNYIFVKIIEVKKDDQ